MAAHVGHRALVLMLPGPPTLSARYGRGLSGARAVTARSHARHASISRRALRMLPGSPHDAGGREGAQLCFQLKSACHVGKIWQWLAGCPPELLLAVCRCWWADRRARGHNFWGCCVRTRFRRDGILASRARVLFCLANLGCKDWVSVRDDGPFLRSAACRFNCGGPAGWIFVDAGRLY